MHGIQSTGSVSADKIQTFEMKKKAELGSESVGLYW